MQERESQKPPIVQLGGNPHLSTTPKSDNSSQPTRVQKHASKQDGASCLVTLHAPKGGVLVLCVHGFELWGCIYGEKLDLIIVFAKFHGCMGTP